MLQSDLNIILPEIVLAIYAMVALVLGVYLGKDKVAGILSWATAAVFVLLGLWISIRPTGTTAFHGMYNNDAFAQYAQVGILFSAAAVLVMGLEHMARRKVLHFEFPVLIALAVLGMLVMVSAGDLITLYMGVELQSLALYVLASIRRDFLKSTEAGLKYFVLGSLSSGMLLYGASLVYGFSGTTLFSGIIEAAGQGHAPVGLLFGIVFMIAGLAFKISAVPFHMWTPDVYEGSPTPVTAFFATAPKFAAMGLFARLLYDAFGGVVGDWQQVTAMIAFLSMVVGSVAAIGQTNIKRLMSYSSIAHMGYALMGLSAGTAFGVQSMLLYLSIYVTMNIGAFAFIMSMERDGQPVTDIRSLNVYASASPGRALALLLLLFSMAGVPPFIGFFAKIYVLRAAYEGGLVWLAIMAVLASVVGAFYYLRVVYFMYFGKSSEEPLDESKNPVLLGFLTVSAAIMLIGVVNLFGLEGVAQAAAASLVQ
ncbi:NADH-quinone oxidoreductase subunit NuoN [Pseudooceanicola sp. CBS1P-1]|uniref:NADH-quinone oxidoreductase subunit N n=1 Tax=Pseudooceanicola albus TaxID=2692189 RepID=A0A6L7FZG4_9RHOB|nr:MULTISPECIES: NADH-quinone oxidoreductase subunit NuoN [Pseudooceanicola]MBT9382518.1 NADH-quinone oxidoreductase subunit NuoN [Pseudooceanicola endophyticus]MXN17059.1 NADH-quinone oxidoreductase subunit NuoN [Pseudooceanicola albus]